MVSTRLLYSVAIISIVLVTSVVVYVATRPAYVLPDLALEVTSIAYDYATQYLQVEGKIGYEVPHNYYVQILLSSLQDGNTVYTVDELGGVVQANELGYLRPGPSWGMAIYDVVTLESSTIQLTFHYIIQHVVDEEAGTYEVVEEGSKTFTVDI
jgi:hypothetical protein